MNPEDIERLLRSINDAALRVAIDAQKSVEPALDKASLQAAVNAQKTLETVEPALDKASLQAAVNAQKRLENLESVLNAAIDMQPTLNAVRIKLTTLDLDYVEFLDLIERERATDTYEYHQHWGYADWAVCTQVYIEEKVDEDAPESTKELFIKIFWLMWRIYQLDELSDAALEWLE